MKPPAVEGAANKELIKFLAKSFKVSKSDILKVDSKPLGIHNGFAKPTLWASLAFTYALLRFFTLAMARVSKECLA